MGEKVYTGSRREGAVKVKRPQSKTWRPLPRRPEFSPWYGATWDWGRINWGSGQLAFALLADVLGDVDLALELAPRFEREIVAKLPMEQWQMEEGEILAWAARLPKESLDLALSNRRAFRACELGQQVADAQGGATGPT